MAFRTLEITKPTEIHTNTTLQNWRVVQLNGGRRIERPERSYVM